MVELKQARPGAGIMFIVLSYLYLGRADSWKLPQRFLSAAVCCSCADRTYGHLRDEEFDELTGGREAFGDYMECIDRDSCLKLFQIYDEMEHSIY